MDSLLAQLLSFPPHPPPVIPLSDADVDTGLRDIVKLLNEVSSKKLAAGLSAGGDPLDVRYRSLDRGICAAENPIKGYV